MRTIGVRGGGGKYGCTGRVRPSRHPAGLAPGRAPQDEVTSLRHKETSSCCGDRGAVVSKNARWLSTALQAPSTPAASRPHPPVLPVVERRHTAGFDLAGELL